MDIKMNSYKSCAVPMCHNTTKTHPNKLFINVPKDTNRRKQWLKRARRNPDMISNKSTLFFCEDHFDLPNDMENYMQIKIMGPVRQIRMKPNCLPSKFECQKDGLKRVAAEELPETQSDAVKRLRTALIEELMPEKSVTSDFTSQSIKLEFIESEFQDKATQIRPDTSHAIVQVSMRAKYRSKYIQTACHTKDRNTSPMRINVKSTGTSPIIITNSKIDKRLFGNEELQEVSSSASSPVHSEPDNYSPSSVSSVSDSSDQENQAELSKIKEDYLNQVSLKNTLRLIQRNPKYYLGLSEDCYHLIDILHDCTKISVAYILFCLRKIRLNTTFLELADQFGISSSYACIIFVKYIPVIASALQPFLFKPNKTVVKRNLPLAFRHKYYDISCVIDCLEIEIKKPVEAVNQDLTWSEHKRSYTVKYLISSTPDGIINYVSPGYGGLITDALLVQNCNFLETLEPSVAILAGRGFQDLDELLTQKGFNLVRPQSVSANSTLSKEDIRKIKEIERLRTHMERVIRRLQEFSMLKPHSLLNTHLLKNLDNFVVIACALVNLQD